MKFRGDSEPSSTDVGHITIVNRRMFLVSAASIACLAPVISFADTAISVAPDTSNAMPLERSKQFEEAFAKLLGDAKPVEGGVVLEMPEIAENGNFVPVTITVDSPMTESDHVTAVHVLSTANPVARVATFRLSPVNAVARVQSRMRLAKTQDVIALAELSNGSLIIATALVKVTIGGCAG